MKENTELFHRPIGLFENTSRPKAQAQKYAELTIYRLHKDHEEVLVSFQVPNPMLSYIFVEKEEQPRSQYFLFTNKTGSKLLFFHQPETEENMIATVFDLDKDPAKWSVLEDRKYDTAEEKITASC